MTSPRVLFLDHAATLGGAELYLLDLLRGMPDTTHVVTLQEGPFADRLREEDISTEIVPAPQAMLDVQRETDLWHSLASIPAVVATVLEIARCLQSFDVLYANSQKALIVGGLAGVLARKPVIWNLHDILTAEHFSDFNRKLAVQWSRWFVDRVIANSHATAEAFVEAGGDSRKVHIVYNGIDPKPFDAVTSEETERLRAAMRLDSAPVVGVFSRLAEWKGQHVLLEALEELDGVHALLVGDALFDADLEYKEHLKALAGKDALRDRVHFLGFREDVPRLMHLVDIVAHTSVAPEPFGRVIVEGMLAGKPVVATKAGGALELLDDRKTGVLVEPGDVAALRRAISELLDGTHADALVKQASQYARQQFSLVTVREQIWRHVQEVTAPESRSPDPPQVPDQF